MGFPVVVTVNVNNVGVEIDITGLPEILKLSPPILSSLTPRGRPLSTAKVAPPPIVKSILSIFVFTQSV